MPTSMYGPALLSILNKEVDYDTDDIKASLHTSAYTPDLNAHRYKSSLTSELAAGGGYSTGGVSLAGKSIGYTAANSWGTARANSTVYALGDIVRPATGNGFLYRAVVAGTSAASPPTFPTVVGQTVVDGGVTWACIGRGILIASASNPAWASATLSGIRYMVLYDNTPATDATRPLLALVDFVTDQAVTAGTFTAVIGAGGLLQIPVA